MSYLRTWAMRAFAAQTAFLLLATSWATAAVPARLSIVVFDDGRPAQGVTIELDDTGVALTDGYGAAEITLSGGRHRLSLHRDDSLPGSVEITADEGAIVQVLATLPSAQGDSVEFDVEGAHGAPTTASAGEATTTATGVLRGRVISTESREPITGAQVYFSGLSTRASTDVKGYYRIELPVAVYQLSVVHPDYSTQTLDGVELRTDRPAVADVELSPAGLLLGDYTVTAPHLEGSVAGVFSDQREGSGVMEVLGAEQMSRAGDSSAADALKRVTGLTIEEGKYVVIRGQPSRYTLTLWNGSPLPSPDPIRQVVPLDLFPTGILSKVEVEKSYDAAVPGSFGGGLIGLETAGVPEDDFAQVSLKLGGNSITTGKTGLTYEGGSTDFLGVDDGTRALPPGLPPGISNKDIAVPARGFSNIWAVTESKIGPDLGMGLTLGKRFRLLGGDFGVMGAASWDRNFQYLETIKRDYGLGGDGKLVRRNDQLEERTDMEVNTGGLLVAALDWERHKVRSNTFFMRKSLKRAEITEGKRIVSDDLYIRDYLLYWSERKLFAQQLLGTHDFGTFDIAWRGLLAQSASNAPDRRSYMYRRTDAGEWIFFNQAKAGRQFTQNEDDILSFDADIGVPVLDGSAWKLDVRGGASIYTQDRVSATRRFSIETANQPDVRQAPEDLLNPADIGDTLTARDQTQTNDNYLGSIQVHGFYLKADNEWSERLRLTFGARYETASYNVQTFVAGGSSGGQLVEAGFKESDILPFGALTWPFTDGMQLRLSGARTLSRPVLNEISPARYYDPESGEEYLGNSDLKPAVIDGLDLRWEWYPSPRETLTLGVFYKNYTDPIEQSFVGVGGSSFLRQIQNAAGAVVQGIEMAARTDFTRILSPFGETGDWSDRMYLAANAAFVSSEVELARQDLATNAIRPLQGQANAVYNLQLGYDGDRHDFDASYNRVGERLFLAGVQGQPDVYLQPIDLLDLNYSFAITEELKLKAKAGNLVDPAYEYLQGSEIYRSYRKGIELNLGLSLTL